MKRLLFLIAVIVAVLFAVLCSFNPTPYTWVECPLAFGGNSYGRDSDCKFPHVLLNPFTRGALEHSIQTHISDKAAELRTLPESSLDDNARRFLFAFGDETKHPEFSIVSVARPERVKLGGDVAFENAYLVLLKISTPQDVDAVAVVDSVSGETRSIIMGLFLLPIRK